MRLGVVILAAGQSSRLGRAKQLLSWRGKTLLEHSLAKTVALQPTCWTLVTGARAEQVESFLRSRHIPFCNNPNWQTGMGSSIRTGIEDLLQKEPQLDAALILLVDQPFVAVEQLSQMVNIFKSATQSILAASYGDTLGVPAIFAKTWFPALIQLDGQKGAGPIIRKNPNETLTFSLEQAAFDIDTEEDYLRLLAQE